MGAVAPVRADDRGRHPLRRLSRWLGGYQRIVRAMPNTPALDRRGHQRRVRAGRRSTRRGRALAGSACSRRSATSLWVDDESDARRGHRRVGQRARVRVLFSRGAGAGGAGARASRGGRAQARVRDVRRRDQARAGIERRSPATLRAQVTSKGGTTERAIASLESATVQATHSSRRCKAAAARAQRARRRARADSDRLAGASMVEHAIGIPARRRLRAVHVRAPAALRHAVAARAVSQSAGPGGHRAHRLGREAAAPRGARVTRASTGRRCVADVPVPVPLAARAISPGLRRLRSARRRRAVPRSWRGDRARQGRCCGS